LLCLTKNLIEKTFEFMLYFCLTENPLLDKAEMISHSTFTLVKKFNLSKNEVKNKY